MRYTIDSITVYSDRQTPGIGIRVTAEDDRERELVSSLIVVEMDEMRTVIGRENPAGSLRKMIQGLIEQHPALKRVRLKEIAEEMDARAEAEALVEKVNFIIWNEQGKDDEIVFPIPEKAELTTNVEAGDEFVYVQDGKIEEPVQEKTLLQKVTGWLRGEG